MANASGNSQTKVIHIAQMHSTHTHTPSTTFSDDKDEMHLNSAHKAFIKLKCFLSKLKSIPVTVFQRHIKPCVLSQWQTILL